ncbi:LysR family transcriptional regulator [Leekyejoonella antrihumi]|uniref:LysR family transcriptional regulator n=1 Tax=Leekyejoonella antrihumi TaxID=1660198 RepID=A0A563E5M5_9MICO|nr:LysR family transcriptional regulator [Leekyejoonella antrihumi]TWP37868.1 LysR family transcriptional regulator [Leekyejoonella antrihumi]
MPLSPRVPDLGAMDMLLSVARLGSLGKAAAEHGVTQPAVSSRISRMERLLGVALIERTRHGSALTPAGSLVADWAREVVGAAASMERGVDALRAESHDRLRIAASMTVAEYLMPIWLSIAHLEDPDLGIALELANSAEVTHRVRKGVVDLGFVEGPTKPRGLRTSVVGHDSLVVVVARSHPWVRRRAPLSARELADTKLIQRERGSGTRSTLGKALIDALGDVDTAPPMLELSSTTAIKSAVQKGLAPAVISSIAVTDELEHGQLVAVPVEGLDLSRTLRAVWPSGRSLLGPGRTFVALARRAHSARDPHSQLGVTAE